MYCVATGKMYKYGEKPYVYGETIPLIYIKPHVSLWKRFKNFITCV